MVTFFNFLCLLGRRVAELYIFRFTPDISGARLAWGRAVDVAHSVPWP